MNRLNHRIAPYILIFALCVMVDSVNAALYKWVDIEGNIRYSERKPVYDEFEELKPPSNVDTESAIETFEGKQKKAADLEGKKKEEAELARIDAENAERKKSNCQLARDRLASYDKPNMILFHEDGSRAMVTKEERQGQIGIANDMIKEFCN